ncbi:MAG TPA: hypothetical protein VEN79_19145 [Terriglobia bacterium]|nr:hypothetical protein [Terriglobia bacterium]
MLTPVSPLGRGAAVFGYAWTGGDSLGCVAPAGAWRTDRTVPSGAAETLTTLRRLWAIALVPVATFLTASCRRASHTWSPRNEFQSADD